MATNILGKIHAFEDGLHWALEEGKGKYSNYRIRDVYNLHKVITLLYEEQYKKAYNLAMNKGIGLYIPNKIWAFLCDAMVDGVSKEVTKNKYCLFVLS